MLRGCCNISIPQGSAAALFYSYKEVTCLALSSEENLIQTEKKYVTYLKPLKKKKSNPQLLGIVPHYLANPLIYLPHNELGVSLLLVLLFLCGGTLCTKATNQVLAATWSLTHHYFSRFKLFSCPRVNGPSRLGTSSFLLHPSENKRPLHANELIDSGFWYSNCSEAYKDQCFLDLQHLFLASVTSEHSESPLEVARTVAQFGTNRVKREEYCNLEFAVQKLKLSFKIF